jgi:hypothetical protein
MLPQSKVYEQRAITDLGDLPGFNVKRDIKPIPGANGRIEADPSVMEINTGNNKFRLMLQTAHFVPPPGAPMQCRALGTVVFDDPADGFHLTDAKNDKTYTIIANHMKKREFTDRIAVARSELAEANSSEKAANVRVKLTRLIELGKKYGIEAKAPDEPVSVAPPVAIPPAEASSPIRPATPYNVNFNPPVASKSPEPPAPAPVAYTPGSHELQPFLGCPVVFIPNRGEERSGLREVPAVCVRIFPDGRISAVLLMENAEITTRENLYRRGTDAGNGRVHLTNCFDISPEYVRDQNRLRDLEKSVAELMDRLAAIDAAAVEAAEVLAENVKPQQPDRAPKPRRRKVA